MECLLILTELKKSCYKLMVIWGKEWHTQAMLKKSSLTSGKRALKRTGAGRFGGNTVVVSVWRCSLGRESGKEGTWQLTCALCPSNQAHEAEQLLSPSVRMKPLLMESSIIQHPDSLWEFWLRTFVEYYLLSPPNWQDHSFSRWLYKSKTEAYSIRHLQIQIIMMKLWKRNWDAELDALEGS